MITSTVTVIVMDPEATATDSRQGLTTDSRQVQIGPDHKNDKESKRNKGSPNHEFGAPLVVVARPCSCRQALLLSPGGAVVPSHGRGAAVLREELSALRLGQATPDTVGLANLQGVVEALALDGAGGAEGLGGRLALFPRLATFPVGMEEDLRAHPAAGRFELPIPQIGVRSGQTLQVRHGISFGVPSP